MELECIDARLLREQKGRFLCEIEIDGNVELAHVPNSAKLSKYLQIENRNVLVIKNANSRAKTRYQLVAVESDDKQWIMVNMNMLNRIIAEYYEKNDYVVQREKVLSDSYKCDLIIENQNGEKTVCEIKGIISNSKEAIFPMYSGERTVRQLEYFRKILRSSDMPVKYIFVILNKGIRNVCMNNTNKEFVKHMKYCVKKNMQIEFFELLIDNNKISAIKVDETKFII